jgi:hypothetical protein
MQFGSWIPALHRTTRTRSHPGPRIPAIQPSSHPATQLAGSQQGPAIDFGWSRCPRIRGGGASILFPGAEITRSFGQWSSGPPLAD